MPDNSCSKFNTLIIIGSGFDRWQGLDTSYESFRKYYYKNIDRVMSEMGMFPRHVVKDGKAITITSVELIYGDVFNPDRLVDEFFWNFENSTALL